MKIDLVNRQETTFLTAQKDLFKIVQKLIDNEKLKKLLFYPVKDALSRDNLSDEESIGLLHNNIRVIPKLVAEEDVQSYVIIGFDGFIPNKNNPEFRDNVITFDIICHLDTWVMENYQLRPYLIMGEIDGMLNNKKLNGIGTVDFVSANQLLLSNDMAGFSLMYRVINDV